MVKTKPHIILGIDPGIADTGFGVIEENCGQFRLLDYGSIKTDKKKSLSLRLLALHEQLTALVKKHQPELAVVEQLFFCTNVKTALIVGQARGVILLTLMQNQLELIELTPLQVKQGLTGYGQADKKQVQQMVKIILNLKTSPKPDDAADALAMAICGAGINKLNSRIGS
ncbi:MAG: crossover junction endodeoxyribonuclease RuvC [Patescibacteria group bacterium]|jgi:crossover junction endodeoxyribonuclease RuvC